jgi:hypothetical protein
MTITEHTIMDTLTIEQPRTPPPAPLTPQMQIDSLHATLQQERRRFHKAIATVANELCDYQHALDLTAAALDRIVNGRLRAEDRHGITVRCEQEDIEAAIRALRIAGQAIGQPASHDDFSGTEG